MVAAAPLLCAAIIFVLKALSWRRQLVAKQAELARLREEAAERNRQLNTAKSEFEKFTKFLENRIDQRTIELKAAQDEIASLKAK